MMSNLDLVQNQEFEPIISDDVITNIINNITSDITDISLNDEKIDIQENITIEIITIEKLDIYVIYDLLNIYTPDFFDDLETTINDMELNDWIISPILSSRVYSLFYNQTVSDNNMIMNKIKLADEKYKNIISSIMNPNNTLFKYISNITTMNINNDTHEISYSTISRKHVILKKILADSEYQIISPEIIANFYDQSCQKYDTRTNVIKFFKHQTKELYELFLKRRRVFYMKHINTIKKFIVNNYNIIGNDINNLNGERYVKYSQLLIKYIINDALDYFNDLIDMGIYAAYPLVVNIISKYISISQYSNYNSDKMNKPLYII